MTQPPTEPRSSSSAAGSVLDHDQGASFRARLALCRGRALNVILPPGTVLDMGCGDGLLARALARYHRHVVAVDPDARNVEQARVFTQGHDVEVYQSPLETFEPPGGMRFDAIVVAGALELTDEPVAILARCARWLTDGGVIIAIAVSDETIDTSRVSLPRKDESDGQFDSQPYRVHEGNEEYDGVPLSERKPGYTIESLRHDFDAAGLHVRTTGGIMFKSLPNSKMHDLPPELLAVYTALGDEIPNFAAELYVVAARKDA